MIRKKILKWLLNEDVKTYIELLKDNIEIREKYVNEIQEHMETLQTCKKLSEDYKDTIKITNELLKLLKDGAE